jgi:hypothetical protein
VVRWDGGGLMYSNCVSGMPYGALRCIWCTRGRLTSERRGPALISAQTPGGHFQTSACVACVSSPAARMLATKRQSAVSQRLSSARALVSVQRPGAQVLEVTSAARIVSVDCTAGPDNITRAPSTTNIHHSSTAFAP